jgi:hypothetical protein
MRAPKDEVFLNAIINLPHPEGVYIAM